MTTINEHIMPPYYYYVDPDTTYQTQMPNPLDDLISVYGLQDLSNQVARSNQDGTRAIKLRKSYKNQIQDLSGKFSTIPTRENGKGGEISHILFQNNPDMIPMIRREAGMSDEQYDAALTDRDAALFGAPNMDWDMCKAVLSQFERSYPSEFQGQGFHVDDLAFDLDGTGKINTKKRRVKSSGSSMATPNSDMQEDVKRRRLD